MSSLSCMPLQAGKMLKCVHKCGNLDHMTQVLHCKLSAFSLERLSYQVATSTTRLILVSV